MNSFIIVDRSFDNQKKTSLEFCQKHGIDPLDITIINMRAPEETKEDAKALKGIALIRHVREKIFLKPLKGEKKALVILASELLSIPAQNSLLKTLEEPPPSTLLILTTENASLLLPTILSRCLRLETSQKLTDTMYDSYFLNTDYMSVSLRLQKAEELGKQKDTALQFLENEMLSLHSSLLTNHTDISKIRNISHVLSECLISYKLIKTTNINVRFALEKLLLTT